MIFKFSKPQRNTDEPDGGGGAAPTMGESVAAQLLAGQSGTQAPSGAGASPAGDPPGNNGGDPPAPAGAPGAGSAAPAQSDAFDESKWLEQRFGGRFKSAQELDDFVSKARTDDDDPDPVKEIRAAIKNGVNPKDYYKIALTDFDKMSDRDKWIFGKKIEDPEITDEVANGLYDVEFPDHEEGDPKKAVTEYRLKQAVKDAEAKWRETQQKLTTVPGFKTADELRAEIQTKSQQVADIFNSQASSMKELTVKIDKGPGGKPLPADQVQEFKFSVSPEKMQEALTEALDPFKNIVDGEATPDKIAGMRLQQILYSKIIPDIVKVADAQGYDRGTKAILAQVNNGAFGGQAFGAGPRPAADGSYSSAAEGVRAQMLENS